MKSICILLAGGTGSRVGSEIPKQYILVKEQPIIAYAIKCLRSNKHIDGIWIVAAEQWKDFILTHCGEGKVVGFSEPGNNRQESILNGLKDINCSEYNNIESVFVHDAARPMLSSELIDRCYESLKGYDGVMPALPMKDTVYVSEGGQKIDGLLNRSKLYAGQAPELFDFKKYFRANISLTYDKLMTINGSSEPALLAGMNIRIIAGDEANIKITTEKDLKEFVDKINKE